MKKFFSLFGISIVSILLTGCGGDAPTVSSSNNWSVLKSNTANGDPGYISVKQNGTTEILVADGIDVDIITPQSADVTLNSLTLAQTYSHTKRYNGSVDVNGVTVTGIVLSGINQSDSLAILVTPGSTSAEIASAIGPTVTNMPTGNAVIYLGESIRSVSANTTGLGYPVSVGIDFTTGGGTIVLPMNGFNINDPGFKETIQVNLNTGDFSGSGGVDDNGEVFNTYGSITGADGEALVGSFDGKWNSGAGLKQIVGAYVAEKQ